MAIKIIENISSNDIDKFERIFKRMLNDSTVSLSEMLSEATRRGFAFKDDMMLDGIFSRQFILNHCIELLQQDSEIGSAARLLLGVDKYYKSFIFEVRNNGLDNISPVNSKTELYDLIVGL